MVHALASHPAIVKPCRGVIGVTRLGHADEAPELVAGARVVGSSVAPAVALSDFGVVNAKNDDILVHEGYAAPAHAGIHEAFSAERGIRLTRVGIQRDQAGSDHDENTRGMRGVAWPVRDAAG